MNDWVIRPWRQAFLFRGRATRRECGLFYLEVAVLFLVLLFISGALAGAPRGGTVSVGLDGIWLLYYLFTIVATLSASVRRLHDQDRPGWPCLLIFVPLVGWVFFFVFLLTPGSPGRNRYGPDPRQASAPPAGTLEEVFS